jgi:hypothetical protein
LVDELMIAMSTWEKVLPVPEMKSRVFSNFSYSCKRLIEVLFPFSHVRSDIPIPRKHREEEIAAKSHTKNPMGKKQTPFAQDVSMIKMTIQTRRASALDVVLSPRRLHPPRHNICRILWLEPLFLLNNLIFQPRILTSESMLLTIYITSAPCIQPISQESRLTKPLNLRSQRNKRPLQHLTIPQQLHITPLPPIQIQRRARPKQCRIHTCQDMIHMFTRID